jgi:hypothetical protein
LWVNHAKTNAEKAKTRCVQPITWLKSVNSIFLLLAPFQAQSVEDTRAPQQKKKGVRAYLAIHRAWAGN